MEEADKDWTMIRMVGRWVFLLVPADPGSPGQRAVKRLLCCCFYVSIRYVWCRRSDVYTGRPWSRRRRTCVVAASDTCTDCGRSAAAGPRHGRWNSPSHVASTPPRTRRSSACRGWTHSTTTATTDVQRRTYTWDCTQLHTVGYGTNARLTTSFPGQSG